jgi:hypothetical protein
MSALITSAATTAGQRRRFQHERSGEDRRELRLLLDAALEAIDVIERAAGEVKVAYVMHGDQQAEYEDKLRLAGEAFRTIESARARLAIRVGQTDPIVDACKRAADHARTIVSEVNNFAVLGWQAGDPPRVRELEEQQISIGRAREAFVAAAQELVGADLDRH